MSRFWCVDFIEMVKREFNFGLGKSLKQIVNDYAGKTGTKTLTIRILRSWVWTQDFRIKVVEAYHAGKLKDQKAVDAMFPNYDLKRETIAQKWAPKYKKAHLASFQSNLPEVYKKVIVNAIFIDRLAGLLLDQTNFFTLKQILFKLEKEDNRSYSRSILDKCSRTLLFQHRVSPWAFTYFLGVKGKDWLKIGRSRNYTERVIGYGTILIDEPVIHLILRYPLKYELEVDKWFKATYYAYRVFKSGKVTPLNRKDPNEFYQLIVLDLFKDAVNQTITLKGEDGSDFQIILEKILPDSKEFADLKSLQKLLIDLRKVNRDDPRLETEGDVEGDVECEFDPDISNHPDLIVYPKRFHDKPLLNNSKKPKENRLFKDADLTAREEALRQGEHALAAGQHDLAEREKAFRKQKEES